MREEIKTALKESLTNKLNVILIKMTIFVKSSEMMAGLRQKNIGIRKDGKKEESTNVLELIMVNLLRNHISVLMRVKIAHALVEQFSTPNMSFQLIKRILGAFKLLGTKLSTMHSFKLIQFMVISNVIQH
jgi:hypothetical protein